MKTDELAKGGHDRDTVARALAEIRSLKRELRNRPEAPGRIAIASASCRLPQANSPEEFWDLLCRGDSTSRPVPGDRWSNSAVYDPTPGTPGKSYAAEASFLDNPYAFDPAPFGISPREAAATDPHHRLILMCTWEALERAGLDPTSLRGSRTGVFVGMSGNDYERSRLRSGTLEDFDGISSIGSSVNFAANRLSYLLGLHGPSLVVDTACSSSLVALHLARQALQNHECDIAIVAGANVMLSPEAMVALSQSRMLSPSGRCHTFSTLADGYARGEGCVALVLRRAKDVPAHAPEPMAMLLSTAVNQDGPTSGITVPNGKSQVELLRAAHKAAGVDWDAIDYVEAHGTGTRLGDPIELRALADVYRARRTTQPLMVGATKPVTGHLEGAAGLVGLLKCLLVVRHGVVPAQPVDDELTDGVKWDDLPFRVPDSETKIHSEQPAAGVSSFGYGGTNSHAIIRRWKPVMAPEDQSSEPGPDQKQLPLSVKLSAASPEAVMAMARSYVEYLDAHGPRSAWHLSAASLTTRAQFGSRTSIVAVDPEDLREALIAVGRGDPHEAIVERQAPGQDGRGRSVIDVDAMPLPSPGALNSLEELVPDLRRCAAQIGECPLDAKGLWSGRAEEFIDSPITRLYFWAVLGVVLEGVGISPDTVKAHGDRALPGTVLTGLLDFDQAVAILRGEHRLGGRLDVIGDHAVLDTDIGSLHDIQVTQADAKRSTSSRSGADGKPTSIQLFLLRAIHLAWCSGSTIDWTKLRVEAGNAAGIPTYPWQLNDLRPAHIHKDGVGTPAGGLSLRIENLGDAAAAASADLSAQYAPVLDEHVVFGYKVVPGVVFMELILRFAETTLGPTTRVKALEIFRPCIVDRSEAVRLHLRWERHSQSHTITVASEPRPGTQLHHATAHLDSGTDTGTGHSLMVSDRAFPAMDEDGGYELDRTGFYTSLWPDDFRIGPSLALVTAAHRESETRIRGVLSGPPSDCAGIKSGIRPELLVLDAAIQLAAATRSDRGDGIVTLGTGFTELTIEDNADLTNGAKVLAVSDSPGTASVFVYSDSGSPVASIRGVANRPVSTDQLAHVASAARTRQSNSQTKYELQVHHVQSAEELVTSAIATTLGIESGAVEMGARLEDLMDSILLVELSDKLQPYTTEKLGIPELFDAQTVEGLIARMTPGDTDVVQTASAEGDTADLDPPLRRRELTVGAMTDLARRASFHEVRTVPRDSLPRGILLTGATGFVGSFLLHELLASTDRDVYCLVRGNDLRMASERLWSAAQTYDLDTRAHESRVHVIPGDLTEQRFGLTKSAYHELLAQVGEVIHNAGSVKWTASYEQLAPHNVDGTAEVLRFATLDMARVVHFTSTVGVFSSDRVELGDADESIPLTDSGPLLVGYAQTKWVAEMMVRRAGERGLPHTIHRINTGPSSVSGAFNRLDHLSLIIKGCVESGLAPLDGPFPVQAAPIDHVARAYVRLAFDPDFLGATSHLVNEPTTPWSDFFQHVEDYGYNLTRLPFEEWRRAVTGKRSGTLALLGLAPFIRRTIDEVSLADFIAPATRKALGVRETTWCPPINRELVHTFLDGFVKRRFFDPPRPSGRLIGVMQS